jgi:hypothetical protein
VYEAKMAKKLEEDKQADEACMADKAEKARKAKVASDLKKEKRMLREQERKVQRKADEACMADKAEKARKDKMRRNEPTKREWADWKDEGSGTPREVSANNNSKHHNTHYDHHYHFTTVPTLPSLLLLGVKWRDADFREEPGWHNHHAGRGLVGNVECHCANSPHRFHPSTHFASFISPHTSPRLSVLRRYANPIDPNRTPLRTSSRRSRIRRASPRTSSVSISRVLLIV